MKRRWDRIIGSPVMKILEVFKPAKNPEFPNQFKKILIIKLAAMGDTILLIPVLHALKKAFPEANLHWLVSPINFDIAKTVPYVDEVKVWKGSGFWGIRGLIANLRKEKYDLVIDYEQWARGTAILSFLSKSPHRWGFDTPDQNKAGLFTHSYKKDYTNHELFDFYNVIPKKYGLKRDYPLELWETEEGKSILTFLEPSLIKKKNKLNILIHPGCGSDGLPREWPLASYAVLIHSLIKNHNAEIYLTSGPEETFKTINLNKLIKNHGHDLGGRLSWNAIISLVKKMDLVISGNTGIMHVAAALQKPQISLHGPTNANIWGPINPQAKIIKTPCEKVPHLKIGV